MQENVDERLFALALVRPDLVSLGPGEARDELLEKGKALRSIDALPASRAAHEQFELRHPYRKAQAVLLVQVEQRGRHRAEGRRAPMAALKRLRPETSGLYAIVPDHELECANNAVLTCARAPMKHFPRPCPTSRTFALGASHGAIDWGRRDARMCALANLRPFRTWACTACMPERNAHVAHCVDSSEAERLIRRGRGALAPRRP